MRRSVGGRRVRRVGAGAAALFLSACGGHVAVDRAATTSGAGGGASTSTTTSTTTSTSTSTTGTTTTGAGGAPTCTPTNERLSFDLALDGGATYGCVAVLPGDTAEKTLSGRVVDANAGGFVVDTCSPLTDCVPTYARLTLADSAPPNPVPAGALVRVHVLVEHPFGCAERLLVTNLASWGGLDNGVRQDEIVWLAAADGVETTLDEAPFTVEKVALHCAVESGQSYLLRFRLRDASLGDPGVDLGMGVEALWTPAGKAPLESWRVRNLRSYESGAQDDYWGYGYWLVQQPGLD